MDRNSVLHNHERLSSMHLLNTGPYIVNDTGREVSSSRRDPTETNVDMATSPRINIYASLPRAVEPGGDVDFNPHIWKWTHCLTLPLETFRTLHPSQKSYKWIRYAIGVVTGSEGTLSTSPDSPNSMDYDDLLAESVDLYYHTSIRERERAFPIDPDIARTQVTSSVHTDRREDFRAEVLARDRGQCVLTELEADTCDAVHLIAHSKSDDVCYPYFQLVFAHHCNRGSTSRLTLSVAVETLLEVTSSH